MYIALLLLLGGVYSFRARLVTLEQLRQIGNASVLTRRGAGETSIPGTFFEPSSGAGAGNTRTSARTTGRSSTSIPIGSEQAAHVRLQSTIISSALAILAVAPGPAATRQLRRGVGSKCHLTRP